MAGLRGRRDEVVLARIQVGADVDRSPLDLNELAATSSRALRRVAGAGELGVRLESLQ